MTNPSASLSFGHEESERGGRLTATDERGTAELTYRARGEGVIVADHTGVPRSMEGRGVGTALIERLYDLAVERDLKIVPACPFVRVKMSRRPEWQAVLTD